VNQHRLCDECETAAWCSKFGCIPITEEDDTPITTPEEAMGWVPGWGVIAVVTGIVILVMVAAAFGPV
jgi:hypothetical protein